MYRTWIVFAATVVAAALLAPARAEEPVIKPGEPLKGELTEKKTYVWPQYGPQVGYATEVPIKLKSGQKISVSVTVVGAKRSVAVGVMDPTGKMIATSKPGAVKTIQLTVDEVNATGTYKFVVVSDQIGDFTLRATGPSAEELDETKLEAEIKELKALLAKKEADLKALKAKKK